MKWSSPDDGSKVGADVGVIEGLPDGWNVGADVGMNVGPALGAIVGSNVVGTPVVGGGLITHLRRDFQSANLGEK